jgi:dTDP-4-amino-4,6-dideoxygalactose transaminase
LAAAACDTLLSLPLYPGLDDADLEQVARAIAEFQEA